MPEPEPEPENSVEGIYPSLDEFDDSLEEIDPVLRKVEGSLELAMQAIRDMDAKIQARSINQPKIEVKTAPIVLMEDNLTKAK